MTTSTEILEWHELSQGTATKRDIQRVYRAADDGGTIQAVDMVGLVGNADPRLHTATSLRRALILIGCEEVQS